MVRRQGTTPRRPAEPVEWSGRVVSVQPRIRLLRSFDERSHSYLGYVLRLQGTFDGGAGEFSVAIGRAAQAKHAFQVGYKVAGRGTPVPDPNKETADLYKISRLKRTEPCPEDALTTPPYRGVPPSLEVYRERGHRRLAGKTYSTKCSACVWGCEMPVEMIVDHWNRNRPSRFRRETFCYGPKSCSLYKAGPNRKVPGRRGWKRIGSMTMPHRIGAWTSRRRRRVAPYRGRGLVGVGQLNR